MTLNGEAIFKEKLSGGLKNVSSHKSENLHFNALVSSKAYEVLDEKVQKSYVS